jgi:hypothetical protein
VAAGNKPHGFALPGCELLMIDSAAFAQGYRKGWQLCERQADGHWHPKSDSEFTDLIMQHLPRRLAHADTDEWRRGFIFGWTLAWYHGPLHREGFCEEREHFLQQVQVIGTWADTTAVAATYNDHIITSGAQAEVLDWGATSVPGHSFIALEWISPLGDPFETFKRQIAADPKVVEVIAYEVLMPYCRNCLPKATLLGRGEVLP